MRLVFRADASLEIGTGHVMRCSAIAEEAIAQGLDCILVGSLGGVHWLEKRYADIECHVIPVGDFQKSQKGDVLIIDSYSLQRDDKFITQNAWKFRVDIVDEFTPVRDSDLFIHPGLESKWFKGDREKFLFGPKFIPIRKSITKNLVHKPKKLSKLVVFGGGTDTYGFAKVMSRELCGLYGFDQAIFFSTDQEYIEKIDSRFRVISFGDTLDHELIDADLVFTTASTSSIEVIVRELPLGVACSVDNQFAFYEALINARIAESVGERVTSGAWKMRSDAIKRLIADINFRDELRMATHDFIDLSGAKRILDAIIAI
jgi:spore coat polysaccharide biosynthesis predicted glycosyltransferase SpsG